MRRVLAGAVAASLLALGLALAACGGGPTEQISSQPAEEVGPQEAVVVHLHAENFQFEPDTIRAKVGQTIRITLDNHDAFLHDYTVDQPEFIVLSASGAEHPEHESVREEGRDQEEAQVSLQPLHIAAEGHGHADLIFKATEPGEYEFYCSVPGHREAGMVGKIIVEA